MYFMLSYLEFLEYYNKNNNLPFPLSLTTKRKLTETELKYRYESYKKRTLNNYRGIKKISNSSYITTLNRVIQEIHTENNLEPYKRFYNSLKLEYRKVLDSLLYLCPRNKNTNKLIFDACHYIERSKNKQASLDKMNIVLLPRALHLALDTRDNIFLNTKLTEIEHAKWWEIILTKEIRDMLNTKYKV